VKTKYSRFTVSVPAVLLAEVDQKLMPDEESRSALVRRLLDKALREVKERDDVEQWIRAYTEQPQTEAEFGWLDGWAQDSLADVEWDEAR